MTPRPSSKRIKSHHYGLYAEKIAAMYLRAKGYRILAERYRNHGGEIDILARRGKMIAVIEVKARQSLEQCEYSISADKQHMLMRAANGLLSGHGNLAGLKDLASCNIRFDVIWIAPWKWPVHIKDAWR